jgi:hypothetical protein
MKNESGDFEYQRYADYERRTEIIDGPEIQGHVPTFQELIELIKFHVNGFVEMRWYAFTSGLESSLAVEDAIWVRLNKIRRVLKDHDFKYTVELVCIQFGLLMDVVIWKAFVYGDEALRQDTALEIQKMGRTCSSEFSETLRTRIADAARGQKLEVPPEVLQRMAESIFGWRDEECGMIQ